MVRGQDIIDGEPFQLESINSQPNPTPQLDFACRNRWMTIKFDPSYHSFRDIYNIGDRTIDNNR